MNTYHDLYARFGVVIGILVGVAIIAITGLFFLRPETDNGWGNENLDWCDQFINFSHGDIQITGQVGDDYIEILLRDTETGVMARITGNNVSSLEMEIK